MKKIFQVFPEYVESRMCLVPCLKFPDLRVLRAEMNGPVEHAS